MTLVQVIFTIILKVAIILFCKENLICWVSLTEIVMPNMLGLKKKIFFFKNLYLFVIGCVILRKLNSLLRTRENA